MLVIVYHKTELTVHSIHSLGDPYSIPSRVPQARDWGLPDDYDTWQVPIEYFSRVPPKQIHALGPYCTIVLSKDRPVGLRVRSARDIQARLTREAESSCVEELISTCLRDLGIQAVKSRFPSISVKEQEQQTHMRMQEIIDSLTTLRKVGATLPPFLEEAASKTFT